MSLLTGGNTCEICEGWSQKDAFPNVLHIPYCLLWMQLVPFLRWQYNTNKSNFPCIPSQLCNIHQGRHQIL